MKAVIQRVSKAAVRVEGRVTGEIGTGFVVLLGVSREDRPEDAEYLADKIAGLRVFEDEFGKMNRDPCQVGAGMLVVSQFTLLGDCRKGRRPSFVRAASPEDAEALYRHFVERLAASGLAVATGEFRAHMSVEIHNDGPVTLLLDSRGDA